MEKMKLLLAMLVLCGQVLWSQETETFDGGYFPPKNWSVLYANPELQADALMSLADSPDGGEGKSFLFSSPAGFPDNPAQYLISPRLDVTEEAELAFKYWVPEDFSGNGAAYRVGWSSTGKAITDFTWTETLYTGIADYYAGEEAHWAEYRKEDLPAGTRYVCIAFVDETLNKLFYVDDAVLPALASVSCDMPSNLRYDAGTSTFSWEETGASSDYEVAYGAGAGFDPETATAIPVSGQTQYVISDCDPLTFYSVYVRAVDGAEHSDWSGPVYFTSGCPDYYGLPWGEGFEALEANGELPECAAVADAGMFGTRVSVSSSEAWKNLRPHTGSAYAWFGNERDGNNRNWYFSPKLRMEEGQAYVISFWFVTDGYAGADTLGVGIGSGQEPSAMELVAVQQDLRNTEYQEFRCTYLPEASGDYVVGIYFSGRYEEMSSDVVLSGLVIDDIAVRAMPDMPSPLWKPLDEASLTSGSVLLAWEESGSAAQWQLALGSGNGNFNPEDSAYAEMQAGLSVEVAKMPSGAALQANTTYFAYVRSVSGDKRSDWSGPIRFTTRQAPLDVPVLEDFSSFSYGMDMPENMAYMSRPGTLLDVATYGYLVQDGYGDSKFLTFEEPSQAGKAFDEWVILRGFNAEESVSYDFSFYLRTNDIVGIDSIGMWVGDAPLPSRMEECFEVVKKPVSAEYAQYMGSYWAESTGVKYVGLRIMGKGSGSLGYSPYLACFDNFEINLTPPCPAPRQVALQATGADSARISWEKADDPEIFWVRVDKVLPDTVQGYSLFPVAGSERSVCIEDLASNTEYQVSVQAVCSGAGTLDSVASAWSSPLAFKTACGLVDAFPMTESFEDFGSGCWTTSGYTDGQLDEDCVWEASEATSWYSPPYKNGAFDGTYSLLYSSYYHAPDSYGELYSPEMDMGDADFSALSFYWWNSDPCDGSSSAYEPGTTSWIYVFYTLDGSEYVLFDSIKACGCGSTGMEAWRYYEKLLPMAHKGYKIRAVGSWGNSEIQLDQVRVKAFDSVDVPAVGLLTQETTLKDVRLSWGGIPASADSLFQLRDYVVYRNGLAIDTVPDTVYVDENLPAGNYAYYVLAVYKSGLVSETNTVEAVVADTKVCELRLSANLPEGRLSLDTGVYTMAAGEVFEVEALPEENRLAFEHWLIDGQETVDSLVLHRVVESDMSVLAVFSYVEYPVSVSKKGDGNLNWEGDSLARAGSEWRLEASAAEHWLFSHWVVNGDSSTYLSSALDFVLETAMEIKAVFVEEEEPQPEFCTLTVAKVGEGETEPAVGAYRYEAGSSVDLEAEAAEGWHFVAWVIGQDSVRAADTAIVLEGDLRTTALFAQDAEPQPEFCTLTVAKVGEGETEPAVGEHRYEAGSSVGLEAEAAEGWHFVAWVIGQDSVRAADTAIVIENDMAATVVFAENLSKEQPSVCTFRIYPNPARQAFKVVTGLRIEAVAVYDATGRLVFKQESVNADYLAVDVSAWTDGVYFVHLTDAEGHSAVRRVVVSR